MTARQSFSEKDTVILSWHDQELVQLSAEQLGIMYQELKKVQVQWYANIIPALGNQRQQHHEFETNQGHRAKHCLKKTK
jgi:hypothetical protein